MSRYLLLLLILPSLVVVPFAAADSFKQVYLSSNTLGINNVNGAIGYVYLNPCAYGGCHMHHGVDVIIPCCLDAGIKLDGLSFFFNSSLMLTASNISSIEIGPYFASNFTFGGPVSVDGQTFTYSISNIHGGTLPSSYTSTGQNGIALLILGNQVDTSSLLVANAQGNMWGVQLCLGDTNTCGQTTGFAFGHVVPEPGTLALVGIGVLALGFVMRRGKVLPHLRT
jgi:hypothetical protein